MPDRFIVTDFIVTDLIVHPTYLPKNVGWGVLDTAGPSPRAVVLSTDKAEAQKWCDKLNRGELTVDQAERKEANRNTP